MIRTGLTLCIAAAAAVVGAQPVTGAAPARTGAIVGVVTTADGEPAAGAEVGVYNGSHGQRLAVVHADDTGHYRVRGLSPGKVRIRFDNDDSGGGVDRWAAEWWQDASFWQNGTLPRIRSGRTVERDAELQLGATISGRLTLPDGSPAAYGSVEIYPADSPDAGYLEDLVDSDGAYHLEGIAAGSYQLLFHGGSAPVPHQWYGGAFDRENAQTITVSPGDELSIDEEFPPGATIKGWVRNSRGGRSHPNADLYRALPDGSWSRVDNDTYTDERLPFTALPSGTYRLYFARMGDQTDVWWPDAEDLASAGDIVLAAGEQRKVTGRSEVGSTISGTVWDEDGSRRGSCLGVDRQQADGSWFDLPTTGFRYDWVDDGEGRYTVEGLRPGTYRLRFCGNGWGRVSARGEWWNDAHRAADADPIVVGEHDAVTGIDAHLEPVKH